MLSHREYLPTLIPVEVEESTSKSWFRSLLSAIKFCHSRGVVHNDIKYVFPRPTRTRTDHTLPMTGLPTSCCPALTSQSLSTLASQNSTPVKTLTPFVLTYLTVHPRYAPPRSLVPYPLPLSRYASDPRLTRPSSLSLSRSQYLSPERARGHLHDTRKSDIWSLGISLFEILVGRTPFEHSDGEQFTTKEDLERYWERTVRHPPSLFPFPFY